MNLDLSREKIRRGEVVVKSDGVEEGGRRREREERIDGKPSDG